MTADPKALLAHFAGREHVLLSLLAEVQDLALDPPSCALKKTERIRLVRQLEWIAALFWALELSDVEPDPEVAARLRAEGMPLGELSYDLDDELVLVADVDTDSEAGSEAGTELDEHDGSPDGDLADDDDDAAARAADRSALRRSAARARR